MMNRWKAAWTLLIGIGCLLAFALTGYAAAPQSAYDEAEQSWAAPALKEWLDLGWLQGYPDGTLKPDLPVTRAEMVSMINRAFALTDTASFSYQDVRVSDWFYADFAKAVGAGYIPEGGNGSIRPQQIITREEAALMLATFVQLELPREKQTSFTDNDQIKEANQGAVANLAEKDIVRGYPDGSFHPTEPVTRASAVSMIDRLLKSGIGQQSEMDDSIK
ncbi:S-layer homology domain-containing protein [Paenibacillus glycanilyticus]|uniref:SLH domain-containing protein n=1 Tax=Paenibacillus glycanilyticus TaxID=126569 RepID=A0ABQ6GJV4_9BACL|nr:S-layer homology domain-containing protein [Paenibacillus glycanilyticus]GLX69902.1 hypothetical protein MU1_42480 [Paenibacillus glycanilyticus]